MDIQAIAIDEIIASAKKDFTRQKDSVITEYLVNNPSTVVKSAKHKTGRKDAVKFYYMDSDGKRKTVEYVESNAAVFITALQKNGYTIATYSAKNNTIS